MIVIASIAGIGFFIVCIHIYIRNWRRLRKKWGWRLVVREKLFVYAIPVIKVSLNLITLIYSIWALKRLMEKKDEDLISSV